MKRICHITVLAALGVGIWVTAGGPVEARIEGEALTGQPFGAGRISISGADAPSDLSRVLITDKDGRVFYPAVSEGVLGRLVGQLLGGGQPLGGGGTVYFLFRGNEPLQVTVYTPKAVTLTIEPRAGNARTFERDVSAWWRSYSTAARQQRSTSDFPPLVQTYLQTMLAQRMGLEPPLLDRLGGVLERPPATTESLELLIGMERLRMETLKNTMLGRSDFGQAADQPVPAEAEWQDLPFSGDALPVEIEPLASRVPQECFYIRFGRFANYLWMNGLIEEHGGEISSMITLRSYSAPMSKRIQRQLALEQTVLSELLGDQVIADVAIIGRDTFTHEGAAIGMLFQARIPVLEVTLGSQRAKALAREKEFGATEEKVEIAGHEVSFLSTPDNRLRSFYAIDGKYHLVTTSRSIVERFYAVRDGQGSLGESEEFKAARRTMPLDRQDTIFVYFSSAFFEGLLSPQYQVELERRMKSVTDMELLHLARLAARGERVAGETIEDLALAGLLPRGFGKRPDGSGPILTEGSMLDSRRGARGYFLPVPDVKIEGLTRDEATREHARARDYPSQWKRMDPLMVGIKRTLLDDLRERIVIDGELAPLDESKYGWILSVLGPPSTQMITPAAGDIVTMQASVKGGTLLPTVPPHYLFLGIQDMPPLRDAAPGGFLQTLQMIRTVPGYVGGWPKPGFLDALPFDLGGSVPDENGFSRLPLGLWRRQGNGMSVLSFDPTLLANVTPQLRPVDAETPAQIRIHVGDLSQAKFQPWVKNLYYNRAVQASAGNAQMLHQLNQQLHVPMEQCRDVAEDLLDAELMCPLGGKYELAEELGGSKIWLSTALGRQDPGAIPADFEAPLLKWFRGADAHLIKADGRITARIELDVQRQPAEPLFKLPFFNLFGSGQKALKPKDKPKAAGAEELPPPLPAVKNPPTLEPPTIELPPPLPKPKGRER